MAAAPNATTTKTSRTILALREPLNYSARARRVSAGGSGPAWASAVSCLVRFAEGKKRLATKRSARVVWSFQMSEPKRGEDPAEARRARAELFRGSLTPGSRLRFASDAVMHYHQHWHCSGQHSCAQLWTLTTKCWPRRRNWRGGVERPRGEWFRNCCGER